MDEKASAYAELVGLSERYAAEVAQDQRRMAEAARREADRIALPYRQAFDEIGVGWRYAMTGLVEGTLSFRGAALEVAQSVERGFIRMLQTTASRAAAGPLASLLGQPAPAAGEGVSDVLGNAVGSWLFGAPQQLGAASEYCRARCQYRGAWCVDRIARRIGRGGRRQCARRRRVARRRGG